MNNNKPVAYINVEERKLEWAEPITWHTPTIAKMDKIPLYTHPVKEQDESFDRTASHMAGEYVSYPVKELTDEEIRTIQAICHLKDVGYDNFIMRFARAILRKAQEK